MRTPKQNPVPCRRRWGPGTSEPTRVGVPSAKTGGTIGCSIECRVLSMQITSPVRMGDLTPSLGEEYPILPLTPRSIICSMHSYQAGCCSHGRIWSGINPLDLGGAGQVWTFTAEGSMIAFLNTPLGATFCSRKATFTAWIWEESRGEERWGRRHQRGSEAKGGPKR